MKWKKYYGRKAYWATKIQSNYSYLIGVNMGPRAAEHKDLKDGVQLEVSI